jgi:hypothetical protein
VFEPSATKRDTLRGSIKLADATSYESPNDSPAYREIHDKRAREISDRERPVVYRVANVVADYMNRIDPDAWDAGNSDQRSVYIVVAGDRIRRAMGLPAVEIVLSDMRADGLHTYSEKGHLIEINPNMSLSSTLSTLTHEMRHAYQMEVVAGRESHGKAGEWTENMLDYENYDADYEDYVSQPIEADAFGFERAVGRQLGLDWPSYDCRIDTRPSRSSAPIARARPAFAGRKDHGPQEFLT